MLTKLTSVTRLLQARIDFAKRAYRLSLNNYRHVLDLAPTFLPDPRIGIGLCFWMLGERERAKKAWDRSVEVVSLVSLSRLNTS